MLKRHRSNILVDFTSFPIWQLFDDCRDKACDSPGNVFQPFELRGDGGREFLLPPSV
jgi:hypothetical protein